MQEQKPLIKRLNFEGGELFSDGTLIFKTPFRISEDKIYLDINPIGRMFGSERNPNKPIELHDVSDETYTRTTSNSVDLTQRLDDAGVDINQTIEFAKNYRICKRF